MSVTGGKLEGVSVFGTALLVSGKEELLAARIVEERRAEALAEQPGADVNRIAASELAETMLTEVVGSSLFSSHIVAIIDDAGATPPEVIDQLIALAKAPGDDLCLILLHDGSVKGKKLIDGLKKAKVPVAEAKPLKQLEVPDFIKAEAKRLRVRLSKEASGALMAALGTDLRTLAGALSQLADDAEGQEIDEALIRRYFAGRAEITSFKVADMVLAGNSTGALELLRWALHTGVDPVPIAAAMALGFRRMVKYRDLAGRRMRDYEIAKEAGMPVFAVRQFASWAPGWSNQALGESIKLIAEADAGIKGAAGDPAYALERMVLGVLAQRRSR